MPDDIVEIKPSIGFVSLNINALWRKLASKGKSNPVSIVAQRFLKVFEDHGIAIPQIQHFLPQITLDKLKTPEDLLAVLTNDVLAQTATLFQIQRSWLDGVDDQLYESRSCYKSPECFFEDLGNIGDDRDRFPVRALYCSKQLNSNDGRQQPMALLLVEKIGDLGDRAVLRYRPYTDGWDWGYEPCRIQLKAMARLVYLEFGKPVPLHRVSAAVLEQIRQGERVPMDCLRGTPLTSPSLEDFALYPEESGQSKEREELTAVLSYIETHNLAVIAAREHERRRLRTDT
ncbi:hypothetical protein [Methylocaldum sp. RMAD-M]|jgi:hypothetical protein|uniref:hypothetical protein n=1 Tax=Methylocaldum sp. RMAD-M TaxID=2806557 RepID=UPI001AE95408|nr:hypothetical protein [Methylocaldum sp. RMAD-M]MBP1152773.1 hypothetical protein [Methylocaldum sp. RMAD-M]